MVVDKEDLVITLRALIISRPGATSLDALAKDYRTTEGESIPYRALGYRSLEEFLNGTGEFIVHNYRGETCVRAVLREEQAHLVSMIAKQKKTKTKKKNGEHIRPPFPPRHSSAIRYPNIPSVPAQRSSNHIQHRMMYKPKQQDVEKRAPVVITRPEKLIAIDPIRLPMNTGAIPKSSVNSRIARSDPKPRPEIRTVTPATQGKSLNVRISRQSSLISPPWTPSPSPPIQTPTTPVSNGFSSTQTQVIPPVGYKEPEVPMSVTPEPEEVVLDKNTLVPIEHLANYCKYMNYSDPHYTYSCCTFKDGYRMFQCRVTIVNKTYCSYPEHCETMADAQKVAAALAINRLSLEEEIKKFPVCREDDVVIAGNLLDILKDYKHGISESAIPEYFRKKYEMSLPENWRNLLYKYSEFCVEDIAGRNIVYSKVSDRPISDVINDLDVTVFEQLQLPWGSEMWTIQITNPVSTTEIYGQIVGENYSQRLNMLMDDIEMATMNTMPPLVAIEEIQEGRIYLVTNNSNWSRVRVDSVDFNNQACRCFCIDTGEQEDYNELYECNQNYLKLPHQAICFSLAFLEDFEGNRYANQPLNDILSRSQFIARVMTTQKEFEINNNVEGEMPIKVILMNPEFPNLENNMNQTILETICNKTPPPQLERAALTLVKITYVSEGGDVFCQVKDVGLTGLTYIQRLTDSLIADEAKKHLRKPLETECPDIRYLIQDRSTGKWYRATPEVPVSLMNTVHRMYCIDFGFSMEVAEEDIYQLEPLSQALCKFPAMAIKCRLYQLQNMTEPIVARIKGLLSEDCECIMKVMVSTSVVPQVNCYMRHQGGTFFCVNESIKIEEELGRQIERQLSSTRNSSRSSSNSPDSENISRLTVTHKSLPKIARTLSNMQKIEEYDIPAVGTTFTLCVVHISNPSNFISQPCDDKINVSFKQLMSNMQSYYGLGGQDNNSVAVKNPEIGQAYAIYVPKNSLWCRGIVDLVIHQQIQVTLCDYGEKLLVSNDNIRVLPNNFRKLPKQAIRCCLYGIKPTHGDWTNDDILRFRGLASDPEKKLYSIIKNVGESPDDGGKIVELTLLDTSSEKDAIFNDLFIKEHRALHI